MLGFLSTPQTSQVAVMLLQIAVIEFARNVLGVKDANSAEFDPATSHPAVVYMPETHGRQMGGTMRLGARRTVLQTMNCITAKLYQKDHFIDERHRHRYVLSVVLCVLVSQACHVLCMLYIPDT